MPGNVSCAGKEPLGWWCPTCRQLVPGSQVNYQEYCVACGTYLGDKQPDIEGQPTYAALLDEVERLRKIEKAAQTLVDDVNSLVADSYGVEGLHKNGDVAPWESLLADGEFEGWLSSLLEAEEALKGGGSGG